MCADHSRAAASAGKGKRAAATVPFEFCKVCNLNHNQGRKHRYFPNHVRALSRFLSCFHDKLSDLRFFLKNPSPLRPEHAARNNLWCVFCDVDVSELGSFFVCSNAIYHLASSEHIKNLKHFLWLHGGSADRVVSFSISESELLKWEKKCEALKVAAPILCDRDGGGPRSSKDIHHDFSYVNKGTSVDNSLHFFEPTVSFGVLPLQSLTNEVLLGSPSRSSRVTNFSCSHLGNFLSPVALQQDASIQGMHVPGSKMNSLTDGQPRFLSNDVKNAACFSSSSILDSRRDSEGECTNGHGANVSNGGHPPWLEENEDFDVIRQQNNILSTNSSIKTGRSRKLNPKRVGAAWAEKRKAELEMEKRGEFVPHDYDANWLPNFGRVWQEGTRKETRKEFEMEKLQTCNSGRQPEVSVKLKPYISKRMRLDKGDGAVNGDDGMVNGDV